MTFQGRCNCRGSRRRMGAARRSRSASAGAAGARRPQLAEPPTTPSSTPPTSRSKARLPGGTTSRPAGTRWRSTVPGAERRSTRRARRGRSSATFRLGLLDGDTGSVRRWRSGPPRCRPGPRWTRAGAAPSQPRAETDWGSRRASRARSGRRGDLHLVQSIAPGFAQGVLVPIRPSPAAGQDPLDVAGRFRVQLDAVSQEAEHDRGVEGVDRSELLPGQERPAEARQAFLHSASMRATSCMRSERSRTATLDSDAHRADVAQRRKAGMHLGRRTARGRASSSAGQTPPCRSAR